MKINDPKDAPPAFNTDPNESVEIAFEDLSRRDPWVEIYGRWRAFQASLTDQERKVVRRWTCGAQENRCSNEEVDKIVRATKGTLDK